MIFTLLSVSGLLIIISNAKFTLIPSIIVFFLFLILHFIRRFSYGFKKFSILNKYASSVIKFWQQVQSAIRSSEEQKTIQQKKTAEEEEANQRSNRLQWLLILNKACYFLASKLRYIQKGGIAFLYYFSSLLYSVFLVILVFAFQNLALYKIDPSSFNNPPKGKFMFFFYYSFNTLFKNNIPDFYPRGSLARLFNSTEIFFGFLVLVILVYLLFTIIREKHKEEIESSIIVIKKQGTELGKIIDNEYHLSVDQAIKEIEKIKGSMLKIIYYFMVNIE
jgi:ABC-type multidrug transport system fused ATPase/permease subunit